MRNFLQALDQKHAKLFKKKKENRKSVLTRHQASRDGRLDPSPAIVRENARLGTAVFFLLKAYGPIQQLASFSI